MATATAEPRVLHFWVKSYDCYNRLSVNPNHDTRDEAFADFQERRGDGRSYFVQMGVWTTEGSLVLNEWRRPSYITAD
jgi:hypothetical protein